MKTYLTVEEIADITDPLTQGAARVKFFERIGCKVCPKPNGQPLVVRAEFEAARSSRLIAGAANDPPASPQADAEALRNRVNYVRGKKAQRRQPARA